METTARIGCQNQAGDVESCLVCVSPGLQGLADLVWSCTFEDVGLTFMAELRAGIEAGDAAALSAVHMAFRPIVEKYLRNGLDVKLDSDQWHVARYAEPTVRGGKKTYAEYMHNDAWYDEDGALAMVNVWFVLNDIPPRNQLVFCACDAADAIPSASAHMLHASIATDEVACEEICWGRFHIFASGQRNTSQRVLLHGAADVPWIDPGEDRRSCELRYTIQTTPERADDAPHVSEEEDDDAGLGGLFDDSESEPSGPGRGEFLIAEVARLTVELDAAQARHAAETAQADAELADLALQIEASQARRAAMNARFVDAAEQIARLSMGDFEAGG
jgi:hypothetical protein